MADIAKSVTVSLRLLSAGKTNAQALRDDHGLDQLPTQTGELYVGQALEHPPGWLAVINHYAQQPQRLMSQSCAAVLFLSVTPADNGPDRTFAICFGTGHHALEPDTFESNFGLKVVLNSVKRDRLRTIDTVGLDATVMQKRAQASRNVDLRDFGIDAYQDLLRLVSGSPHNIAFANSLAGRDALTLRASLKPSDLPKRCQRALTLFASTEYKTDFGFIDHVTPVGDNLARELDTLAYAALTDMVGGGVSDLHLALPNLPSPEIGFEIGYFGAGLRPGTKQIYGELAIEDYVAELQAGDFPAIGEMATLRASHEIRVIENGQGDTKHRRKLYSCFVFETERDDHTYVLFDGQWRCVDRDFYKEVQAVYVRLLKPAFVVATTAVHERAFITELYARGDLLNIDQVKASPRGAKGANLEPCDFLSLTRQFIHLKDGHGSAPLSHLWNQGLVASASFLYKKLFRAKFRQEAKKRQVKAGKTGFDSILPMGSQTPDPRQYTVIFGVMRRLYQASGDLGLPFFSKVICAPSPNGSKGWAIRSSYN